MSLTTHPTKNIAENIQIDTATAVLVLETPTPNTFGIYRAKQVRDGRTTTDEQLWLETNGDPQILPHSDYPDELAAILADAGITQAELEAAIGMPYSHWCN